MLRENRPWAWPWPPFWGLGLGAIFWPIFLALFHKQNSAGEKSVGEARGRGPEGRGLIYVKRGLVGLSPSAIIFNFTRGLPVYPDSRVRAGRGISTS